MVGINYNKVAKLREEKGRDKEAADYYVRGGRLEKAYELYEKVLSDIRNKKTITTQERKYVGDITKRFTTLNPPLPLKELLNKVRGKIKRKRLERPSGLEKKFVFATLSIISLVFALFFSIFSLTGYSIRALAEESFRLGGVALFVLGLVFAFLYFKNKK